MTASWMELVFVVLYHIGSMLRRTQSCVVFLTPKLVVCRMAGRFAICANTQYVKLMCVKVICGMSHKSTNRRHTIVLL